MVESQPTSEDEQIVCVCNNPRDLGTVELHCSECRKWYHGACTTLSTKHIIPFQLNYVFTCRACHEKAVDHLLKSKSTFLQACITALGNLMCKNVGKRFFCRDKDIVPYIELYWDMLFPNRAQSTMWPNHVHRALTTETVFCSESVGEETLYTLVEEDLSHITPVLFKASSDKTDPSKGGKPPSKKGGNTGKRKTADTIGAPNKKSKLDAGNHRDKLSKWGYPIEHPHNKDNYRYTLAQPDPLAGTTWEQELAAGKPLPSKHYRSKLSDNVLLALHDKAQQLKVDDDRVTVVGDKGYCLIRATHGVKHGTFYYECTVLNMPDNSACRVGWAQQYANLQAPCGYDKFGYSWRSRKGTIFHNSRGKRFSSGYGVGDTLGFLISLPKNPDRATWLPPPYKDQALIKFKNYLYFEEKDESDRLEKGLRAVHGSEIRLYKNGVACGTAWRNIYRGEYFPTVSLYRNCTVQLNFGPNFMYTPEAEEGYPEIQGASALADQSVLEHTLGDLIYHVEDRMNTVT